MSLHTEFRRSFCPLRLHPEGELCIRDGVTGPLWWLLLMFSNNLATLYYGSKRGCWPLRLHFDAGREELGKIGQQRRRSHNSSQGNTAGVECPSRGGWNQ